ncbi:MAG: phosphodiester glycosidase family protein [Clostridiales bacterium]|nr:phosphodiester glycosidase family protein [Clostridiales bacterium]
MKTRKHSKSVISLILSIIMVMTVMAPITASASLTFDETKLGSDTYLTSKTDYTIAPGITETHITTNNSSGSRQNQGYAIEVDLNDSTTSILASYKDYDASSWGMQSVRNQAEAAEKALGVNVVAGVNADFFNMQTGKPTGYLIMQGTAYTDGSARPFFAINKDGTASIYSSGITDTSNIKEAVGGSIILVKDGKITSAVTSASDAYAVQDTPRTVVGIKEDGSVVFYVVDGRQAPTSSGMSYLELAYIMLSLGCVDALNLDGGGSTTMISQHEGSSELVCRNSPSDGSERTVSSAILICSTAVQTGIFDHASLSPNNELYTVGATVTFEATGVDSAGYAAELPAGGYFALENSACGTIDASTGVFTAADGYEGEVAVDYIVDGVVAGSTTITIVTPDEWYADSSEVAVGPGVTTDFGIIARYENREVNLSDGDIIWTIVDQSTGAEVADAGTFDGLTFTATEDGAYNVYVTATYARDESLTDTLTVFIGSKTVVLYDFEYTTDADEAAANDDLEYISSYTIPTYGSNLLSSMGSSNSAISQVLYADNMPLYLWPNGAISDNDSTTGTIVSSEDGEPVRFGSHSLRIDFDFSSYNSSSNANVYLRVTGPQYTFDGSPSALGAWVYAPEGTTGYILYLQVANKTNTDSPGTSYGSMGKIDWVGWKYLEFDLTDESYTNISSANEPYGEYQGNGIIWISYQPGNGTQASADMIYIDDITLIYGANTADTTNPVVNFVGTVDNEEITDGETVFTSNTVSLKAMYADTDDKYMTGIDDEATKMYIDGVDVTDLCYINEGDDEIYFYDAYLADGVHVIDIEVYDIYGNSTTDTRYFTVAGGDENTEVALEALNSPVLGSDYNIAVTTNNEEDVLSAEITVKVLSKYTSYWQDVTVTPAANYELSGEAVYNTIRDTLTFTVVRSEDASSENDTGTIATITTAVPSNTPESLEVTHRVSAGVLTYASEKTTNYVNGFSGKIVETCGSAFTISPDSMIVGSDGGYIYVTDAEGNIAEGVEIYDNSTGALLGTTDADGKIFTDAYVSEVVSYSIYAVKGEALSFIYTSQSFNAGGDSTGAPTYVKLNVSDDTAATENITWMSNPLVSGETPVIMYAEKSAYEANGTDAFTSVTGTSQIVEYASSGSITGNYAVRINAVSITGLAAGTEYAYIVGDGTNMSAVKYFTTTRSGYNTNFFVIGDTQATDTTNTALIAEALAADDVDYDFGIQTGDAVDNGGNYVMWENIAKIFTSDFLSEQTLVTALGNHEYYGDLTGGNSAAYYYLPGTEEDGSAPICYSVQYGNVYIAVINYGTTSTYAEAIEWLREDAAAATANWKILVTHQPTYYTNPAGNSDYFQNKLVPVIDEVGIDVVFSGHDHSYARTEPMTGGEIDTTNGTVYYICGSTGEKSYPIVNNDAFNFSVLDEDYNAIYLTASATDTQLIINTYDMQTDGTFQLLDTCTISHTIDCTSAGHDYVLDENNEYMTCSVCGYTTEADLSSYTGFITDSDGHLMYYIAGNKQTGWTTVGDDYYYFDSNGYAITGTLTESGHTYTFGDDGKLTKGSLEKQSDGTYCYYIAGSKQRGWHEIDGKLYYFNRANAFKTCSGTVTINDGTSDDLVYTFSDDGYLIKGAWYVTDDGTQYYWGANPVSGFYTIDEDLYYFDPANYNYMVTSSIVIDGVAYTFGPDGKFAYYGTCVNRELIETVEGSCTEDGYELYLDTLDDDTTQYVYAWDYAEGHTDSNGDYVCDVCGETINWFLAFLYKLFSFFRRVINFIVNLFT